MQIDPAWFRPEAVSDESREFVEAIRDLVSRYPRPQEMESPDAVRLHRRSGKGPFGPIVFCDWAVDRAIPGPAGDIPIRVFHPDRVDGVYLHIHGGGWVLGAVDQNDVGCEAMALAANVAVVSVGYRLAPEHKWPAGNDDCEAAAVWLVANAASEFGTDRIVIGGESAGAHLAMITMLRLRDTHDFTGWSGANLVYGAYDFRRTWSKDYNAAVDPILDGEIMEWYGHHYLAGTRGITDLGNPDVSPVMADVRGLPPALFTVGTLDPLLDENLTMAVRYAASGNETELEIIPGGFHGFDAFPWPPGQEARARMHEWVRDRLV